MGQSNPEAGVVHVEGAGLPPLKMTVSNAQDYPAQSNHEYALEIHQLFKMHRLSSKEGFSLFLQPRASEALQSLHLGKEAPQLIGA